MASEAGVDVGTMSATLEREGRLSYSRGACVTPKAFAEFQSLAARMRHLLEVHDSRFAKGRARMQPGPLYRNLRLAACFACSRTHSSHVSSRIPNCP
jgi:hypothetical protein